MKMKLEDQIPLHEIQIDVLSNTPDNSIMSVYTTEEIAPNLLPKKPEITVTNADNEIKAEITELSSVQFNQIYAVLKKNPPDKWHLSESLLPLNVEKEQCNDTDKVNVKSWILNKIKLERTYSTFDLNKYHKHLSRITLEHGILYRKFFDHTGQNYHKTLVVPKHLRTELLYLIDNSKMKGYLVIQKTVREFRRKYYFPRFIELLVVYINNCLTCAQGKSPKHKYITPPLNPVSSNTSLPGGMHQTDIVGKIPILADIPICWPEWTTIYFAKKNMFAHPLTSISAERDAKCLVSCTIVQVTLIYTSFNNHWSRFTIGFKFTSLTR